MDSLVACAAGIFRRIRIKRRVHESVGSFARGDAVAVCAIHYHLSVERGSCAVRLGRINKSHIAEDLTEALGDRCIERYGKLLPVFLVATPEPMASVFPKLEMQSLNWNLRPSGRGYANSDPPYYEELR